MKVKEGKAAWRYLFNAGVIVAALGYFVDIYDLVLFSAVRQKSLLSLGYSNSAIEEVGLLLINIQMLGMLIGGVFWGILGDKKGRLSVLFGSILLYSLANIANGFVTNATQYALLRFIAGVGLAGELGAGITLVAESLPADKRGWGTMIVATIGVSGAVAAGLISKLFAWQSCYFIGGGLGLALLLLRIGVYESGIFQKVQQQTHIAKGNFFQLFKNKQIFLKYLYCILIGLPTWYTVGILVTFSPEFAKTMDINGTITGADAIIWTYGGITLGDFACGFLSQLLHSRKKAVLLFILFTAFSFLLYFTAWGKSAEYLYFIMALMGFGTGFWAVTVTNAAEQFGTNIRATVATSVPNFIRGALPLMSFFYTLFISFFSGKFEPGIAKIASAALLGVFIIIIPLFALSKTEETFGKNLDYTE